MVGSGFSAAPPTSSFARPAAASQPYKEFTDRYKLYEAVTNGLRPPTDGMPIEIVRILDAAWNHSPSKRPSAKQLAEQIRSAENAVVRSEPPGRGSFVKSSLKSGDSFALTVHTD